MGLLCGAAAALMASQALARDAVAFDIAAQDAGPALNEFSRQSGLRLLFPYDAVEGKRTPAISGELSSNEALNRLLAATGLVLVSNDGRTVTLAQPGGGSSPQSAGAGGDVDALIVTAQKREENIQDVPIAISAFSQQALDEQKIEGGFDLLKAIPNVTFSKNNFSGYNFSIRGIGTKAISVATDPAVAVAFNSSPLIRNRLFEQEYYDLDRVEVLRGPQGTLYGRNATAGVVNVISQKADLSDFSGSIKGEVGNFDSRRVSGHLNMPIVDDVLAVRLAGAATMRDGYDYNATTRQNVNGRDLWSTRLSVGFQPRDWLQADLIWERFSENDDRSRTGKQLCHRDDGPSSMGPHDNLGFLARGFLSQGCKPGSLYDVEAFGTPNGVAIPFVLGAMLDGIGSMGRRIGEEGLVNLLKLQDPYGGLRQSSDLRIINSAFNPHYRADADVIELNLVADLSESLRITSQTLYNRDDYYSDQDFNRFNTVPVFNESSNLFFDTGGNFPAPHITPNGIYCDPQLGCSGSILGMDISRAKSQQFYQEFRAEVDVSNRVTFSVGANYLKYKTVEDYFVMFNILTAITQSMSVVGNFPATPNSYEPEDLIDPTKCTAFPSWDLATIGDPGTNHCTYIDPNPYYAIDGEGHNYYRSRNPYKVTSGSVFGELYWQATDSVQVIAGLRYTDDRKSFTPVPTQLLLAGSPSYKGGTVGKGYPELPDIDQKWGEFSGRLSVQWRPELALTDDTMLYATYSRGYKGGGANPPGIGFDTGPAYGIPGFPPFIQTLPYPKTFDPEFVNAYEVGAKNTLLGGSLILNMSAFFYDYSNYQVSQIKDRTAVNENFDATVWGLELEGVWSPTRNLRVNGVLGYQDTSVADGESSIDLVNRTQGNPDFVVLKPFLNVPSNCVVRKSVVEEYIRFNREEADPDPDGNPAGDHLNLVSLCPGTIFNMARYFPLAEGDLPNEGLGFYDDLGGNELPNAPHWTASLGVQHSWDVLDGWRATVRGDAYWQSQSWHRVYNLGEYDKLHGWYNLNLSMWFERPEDDLKIELYVKNVLDDTPITDAFLNSDDTALTTNVFTLDPRLIGVSVRKAF